jgi:hypothetical protein
VRCITLDALQSVVRFPGFVRRRFVLVAAFFGVIQAAGGVADASRCGSKSGGR